jgi:hypothetical protein
MCVLHVLYTVHLQEVYPFRPNFEDHDGPVAAGNGANSQPDSEAPMLPQLEAPLLVLAGDGESESLCHLQCFDLLCFINTMCGFHFLRFATGSALLCFHRISK